MKDKRDIILDTMLKLCAHEGLSNVTMSMLIKEAALSSGTIYYYFDSKEHILKELFIKLQKSIARQIFVSNKVACNSYKERFGQVWISLFNYFIQYPDVLSLFEQFAATPFHFKEQLTGDLSFFYENDFYDFFRYGQENGAFKSCEIHILTSFFMGPLTLCAKKHNAGTHSFTPAELHDMSLIIWDGVKAN